MELAASKEVYDALLLYNVNVFSEIDKGRTEKHCI